MIKISTVFFLLFITLHGEAQIYLDNSRSKVERKEDATYYLVLDTVENIITEKRYLINDTLVEISHYAITSDKLKEGKNCRFYDSGKLQYDIDYSQGLLNGYVKGYFENGNLKRNDLYKNDTLIEGKCFTVDNRDTAYYIFERQASYFGRGLEGFRVFVTKTVRYPAQAHRNGIQGRVLIQFAVNSKGKVVDVKVIESPNSLLNNAAIDAVMASGTWEPAIQEGRKVKQQFVMPIIFLLE